MRDWKSCRSTRKTRDDSAARNPTGVEHSERDRHLSEYLARLPLADYALHAVDPSDHLDPPFEDAEQRPFVTLVHGVLTRHERDVRDDPGEPFAIGRLEVCEDGDLTDLVRRHHERHTGDRLESVLQSVIGTPEATDPVFSPRAAQRDAVQFVHGDWRRSRKPQRLSLVGKPTRPPPRRTRLGAPGADPLHVARATRNPPAKASPAPSASPSLDRLHRRVYDVFAPRSQRPGAAELDADDVVVPRKRQRRVFGDEPGEGARLPRRSPAARRQSTSPPGNDRRRTP